MAASGMEILQGQLEHLRAQREQIYTEQLLPLDDAIGHLEKLVSGQNGKVKAVTVAAPTAAPAAPPEVPTSAKAATNGAKSRQGRRTVAKAAPTKSAKAPAKSSKAPAQEAAPVTPTPQPEAPPASVPEAAKPAPQQSPKSAPQQSPKSAPQQPAKAAPAKKPTVKLKPNYRDKSVDDAIVALFGAAPTQTWKTEDVVNAITAPSSKSELNTYIRSLRLYLANGASQGKWQKLSDGPAVYAAKDYKAS